MACCLEKKMYYKHNSILLKVVVYNIKIATTLDYIPLGFVNAPVLSILLLLFFFKSLCGLKKFFCLFYYKYMSIQLDYYFIYNFFTLKTFSDIVHTLNINALFFVVTYDYKRCRSLKQGKKNWKNKPRKEKRE